jgi:hypothetical protein
MIKMQYPELAKRAASEKVNHCRINMENQDDYLSTLEELEAARNQLANYQSLLRDLPELYERKFEERLRPIRDQNRALSQEGAVLREQLDRALPASHQPKRQELQAATDAPLATQPRQTADRPVVPLGRSRTLLPIGLAGAASLLLLATLGPLASWMHYFKPSPPASGSLAPIQPKQPAPVSMAAQGELILMASAPTWLEVHDADDHPLIAETFQGKRRIPLGQGLRLLAGRPDLITIQLPGTSPRRLGSIDEVGWQTIKPTDPIPSLDLDLSNDPAAEALILRASEPTWLEVRDANNRPVLAETFQGQRRLPLGTGLRLLAGRPDLLTVQRQGKPPERLGEIDDLHWFSFSPAAKPRSAT